MIRLALATDVHFDPNDKLHRRLAEAFVQAANDFGAEHIIDIGDHERWDDPDPEGSARSLSEIYNRLSGKLHMAEGNHDVVLTRDRSKEIFSRSIHSSSFDAGGQHFVIWSPSYKIEPRVSLDIPPEDLDWLMQDLARTTLPTQIFSHVPLTNRTGDKMRDKIILSYYNRGPEYRRKIIDSGKVHTLHSGHLHRGAYEVVDGLHCFKHQSLTHINKQTGNPFGAFALIEIDGDRMTVDVKGEEAGKRVVTIPTTVPCPSIHDDAPAVLQP